MPSCSNSSNISSSINSVNISQGSGGSRFVVQIDKINGLTAGSVIRYDVPTAGYTASKADTAEHAEVFGIIESYNSTTNKFNVVMGGSVTLSPAQFASMPIDPTGGGGGNDIYFLSGITAGKLQNLAPDNIDHIIKPVYQIAPHGSYTGTVINYSGYRLGGDIQAGIDTIDAISKLGGVQIVFEKTSYEYPEEALLRYYGLQYSGTDVAPIYNLNATEIYDWKLEYINVSSDNNVLIRYIDFKDFCDQVMPIMNGGWVERVKVDTGYNIIRNNVLGKAVRQINHSQYDDSAIATSWYGTILDYDVTTRYLYILRPAYIEQSLIENINLYMAETTTSSSSGGSLTIMTGTVGSGVGTVSQTITITETNRSIQLFGFIVPIVRLSSYGTSNEPFYFQTIYDPYNQTVYETTGISPKVYMKIKNRGVSLVIPDNVSVSELSANTVTLSNNNLQSILDGINARLDCLQYGLPCP